MKHNGIIKIIERERDVGRGAPKAAVAADPKKGTLESCLPGVEETKSSSNKYTP